MNEPSSVRVIKWDGEAPKRWRLVRRWPFLVRDIADPVGHPKCLEIVDFPVGRGPVVTYRQEK